MSSLRIVFLLLALLSGGLAHASHPFENVARASDEELDRMRGGFVVNWNGQVFLMPFSIDGIERLTQINGQTFINGALVSPRVNPQALIPLSQIGQIGVDVAPPTPTIETPALALDGAPPAGVEAGGPAAGVEAGVEAGGPAAGVDSGLTEVADPLAQTASGGSDATNTTPSSSNLDTTSTSSASTNTNTANAQVTTRGSLIVIQNGVANSIVLPPGTSLDSLSTIIQNSVNDQVIRNITTMNITIDAQILAAQSRLDAILNQHGLR